MLRQLRENTKVILWVVVVTFVISIFAVWGMDLRNRDRRSRQDTDVIGSVNGIKIDRRFYAQNYQEVLAQLRMQRGENYDISPAEGHLLRSQAWETSIQKILVGEEIKRLGIIITDNELVSFLRRNPHPGLMQSFKTESGDFDYQAYLRALSDPQMDWTLLERWGRQVLPERKLQIMWASQVHIPEREIQKKFEEQNVSVKARYVKVPIGDAARDYEPTPEEISQLYQDTQDQYREFEKRAVEIIEIEKKASTYDEQDVLDRMLELREEIMEGADFAAAAASYSDDPVTAARGGDLGFFGTSGMDSIFTYTAFSLDTGQVSQPVRTEFGYHLIKTVDKKTEEGEEKVRARHILMSVNPGYETRDSLGTLIQETNEMILEKGFAAGAAAKGLEVKKLPPFARGAFLPGYGYLPNVIDFAFGHKKGKISHAIESESSIYYVKVLEVIPERTKNLDEVRTELVEKIRRQRNEQAARKIADEIRRQALISGDLEAAAHSQELPLQETPLFKMEDRVPDIGVNTTFAAACHRLPLNNISSAIQDGQAWYIIQVVERTAPDMNQFAQQRDNIHGQLVQDQAIHFMASWYEVVRENAKVEDYREMTLN
ncbi:MAG: SurA N-terminal domain-containing protein [Candidatus Krumholzibacteriota bacterium]|nr:SurA N-terminal domain-containing protein [Candidatus Krumholzibacteriota bacterium]